MSRIKRTIAATPVVGRLARVASHVSRLPAHSQSQDKRLANLEASLVNLVDQISKQHSELQQHYRAMQTVQDDIQKRLSALDSYTPSPGGKKAQKSTASDDLFANDHALDVFYANFEDRFRGNEELIGKRLKVYLPYFLQSKLNFNEYPVLDIGSGRGELLNMLKQAKIKASGLDINVDMVSRANNLGLKTEQGDALSHLSKAKNQSLGAITGFHIAEHIPFNILFRLFKEAHRVLAVDGFVIFETPNPENLVVSGHNFYMDPSHLHPLPPALLQFTLETCGFSRVEIKRLHPDIMNEDEKKLPQSAKERLYGPRDYAVIGYK